MRFTLILRNKITINGGILNLDVYDTLKNAQNTKTFYLLVKIKDTFAHTFFLHFKFSMIKPTNVTLRQTQCNVENVSVEPFLSVVVSLHFGRIFLN
jgi:hypothetical protein